MSRTAVITVIAGVGLTALGAWGYFGRDTQSVTALIPAFFGLPLVACGLSARSPRATIIAMHFAVVIALVGSSSLGMALAKWSELMAERPVALYAQLATGGTCLALLIIYVASFITARRRS
jgi:hypothetical protein